MAQGGGDVVHSLGVDEGVLFANGHEGTIEVQDVFPFGDAFEEDGHDFVVGELLGEPACTLGRGALANPHKNAPLIHNNIAPFNNKIFGNG